MNGGPPATARETSRACARPRVGWLMEHPTLSGGERSALVVAQALHAASHAVDLLMLAPRRGPLAEALGRRQLRHQALRISRRDAPPERWIATLARLVRALDLSLLHANGSGTADLAGPAAARAGIPSVGHIREIIRHSAARVARLATCTRLVAVSDAAGAALVRQGVPAERVVTIHNGIDVRRWSVPGLPASDPLAADPRPRLLAVGQLVRRKGLDVLLEALARTQRPAVLWVAGERWSDKAEAHAHVTALRQRAEALALPVRWLGWRGDIPALMASADLLVHPARQEPLGRVILEAMAAGLPLVTTAVGGSPELLGPLAGQPGAALVPPDAPDALARAIDEALLAGRAAGAALRARCEATFTVTAAATQLASLYHDLLRPTS